MKRDVTIDVLRGLAVLTMIAANGASYLLAEPHPFWFRMYGSFAAPTFITLSGLMVAFAVQKKDYGFRHFATRGLIVIGAGAFLDMAVWRLYPFTYFDVLFVIGLSIPLAHLFLRIANERIRWLIILLIFAVTPLLRGALGYTDYPTEIAFPFKIVVAAEHPTHILNHLLVDGWFPLFPWVGFSLLGANTFALRSSYSRLTSGQKLLVGAVAASSVAMGFVLWKVFPTALATRHGYSEVFYPPTTGYVFMAIGIMVLAFATVDIKPDAVVFGPLRAMGSTSLFIYLLHYALLEYVLQNVWEELSLADYLLVYLGFALTMILISFVLGHIKGTWKNRPSVCRVLLGG